MVSPISKPPGNFQDQMVLVYGLEPYLCAFVSPADVTLRYGYDADIS